MYSPLQIIPEPTPKIETLLLTTFLNEKLYITCPGYDIRLKLLLLFIEIYSIHINVICQQLVNINYHITILKEFKLRCSI